ncbi:MAG: hypothetical protein LLF99_01125 [Desulfobacteraceae bacterium]|nr:hypothetical protein [Desulfobacteraceae bacterium]
MGSKTVKLEDLVSMDHPGDVLEETVRVALMVFPGWDPQPLRQAYGDIVRLFRGEYPGYRGCNTGFHDLKHTNDCLMAMARLVHGAYVQGCDFRLREAFLGFLAALMHDTGYIQAAEERSGTGAKHTLAHVGRSIDFMEGHFVRTGYTRRDFEVARSCLQCTALDAGTDGIPFESAGHEMVGRMLGTADLLGQMGDRTYLERLPFLYEEFREGRVPGFPNELELLRRTPEFWEFAKRRFANELGGVDRYMRAHFSSRWGIDRDLYRESIEGNMRYLEHLLKHHEKDYTECLRRDGLMDRLKQLRSARSLHHQEAGCQASDRAR